jgi:hypothetical protein
MQRWNVCWFLIAAAVAHARCSTCNKCKCPPGRRGPPGPCPSAPLEGNMVVQNDSTCGVSSLVSTGPGVVNIIGPNIFLQNLNEPPETTTTIVFIDDNGQIFQGNATCPAVSAATIEQCPNGGIVVECPPGSGVTSLICNGTSNASQIPFASGILGDLAVTPNVLPVATLAFDIGDGASSLATTELLLDEFQETQFAWTASKSGVLSNLDINVVTAVSAPLVDGAITLEFRIRQATTSSGFVDTPFSGVRGGPKPA